MLVCSYAIRLKNARLFDPASGIDQMGELLIHGGKIVTEIPVDTKETVTIDVNGALVTPGLIDFHAHCGNDVTLSALPADLTFLPAGVTAMVDAGSRGIANISQMLNNVIPSSIMTIRCLLNLAPTGQVASASLCENINPKFFNEAVMRQLLEEYGDLIIGLKLRLCKATMCSYGDFGLEPLEKAVEIASRFNRFLAVHVTDLPCSYRDVMPMFRKGDILVHPFQGLGKTIIKENGHVDSSVVDAKNRGVIFDLAAARYNQNFSVARTALSEGIRPDIYSTDIVRDNVFQKPAFHLPYIISTYHAMGVPLDEIITGCTAAPAKLMGMYDRIGSLKAGCRADITILKVEHDNFRFDDRFGNSIYGNKMFVPAGTICGGTICYLSPLFEQETK